MNTKTIAAEADQPDDMLAYVLAQLEACRGQWPTVSKEADVPYDTITKIAQRQIEDPKVSKLQRLANYFRAREAAAV